MKFKVTSAEYEELMSLSADEFRAKITGCLKVKREKDERSKTIYGYSKDNRKNPTIAEDIAHRYLKSLHVVHQRQVPMKIGKTFYIVDFLVGNKRNGFILEVDGGYHMTPGQVEKDNIRTWHLKKKGYRLIRITNEEVYNGDFSKIDAALAEIKLAAY